MSRLLEATWFEIPVWTVVVIGLIVLVGSFVQATVGLGLGMLGAPTIALLEPQLVPTMLLMLAVPISAAVAWSDRHHVDWRVVWWSLPMRVPGTALGVWLVTAFSPTVLGVTVAVMVLVAVALTLHTVEVPSTRATLAAAGLVAGTTGTAAAIGGPPMAIVLAHRPSREARGTMSVFFFAGSVLSIVWFAVVGELPHAALVLGACYLPLVAAAFPLGAWAHRRFEGDAFRHTVLGICAAAAVVLLVRSLA